MKVKWWVEGIGCFQHRCGAAEHVVEIEDEELAGLDEAQKDRHIEDIVADEFDRQVYPQWSAA